MSALIAYLCGNLKTKEMRNSKLRLICKRFHKTKITEISIRKFYLERQSFIMDRTQSLERDYKHYYFITRGKRNR